MLVVYLFPRAGEKETHTAGKERPNQAAGIFLRNTIQGSLLRVLNEFISTKQTCYSLFI